MGKKILSFALSVILLLSCFPLIQASEFPTYYSDVWVNQWFYDDVIRVSQYGYLKGVGDNQFAPQTSLTRAMAVTILGRISNVDIQSYPNNSSFSDVNSESWYGPYVSWAADCGIVYGTAPNTFSPNDPVTREQMAALFFRFCEFKDWELTYTEPSVARFEDIDDVSDYALEPLEFMRTTGIIRGDDLGNFNPKKPITRAEAAAMISRLIDAAQTQNESLDSIQSTQYIIHAAGSINGYASTNSKEALENAYELGNRLIEIDFAFTSDGVPVCIHDWNYRLYPGYIGTPPTLDEFSQSAILGLFTPLTLSILADYMTEHDDLYIITDTKGDNIALAQIIMEQYPQFANRFIVQVYSEEEYHTVRAIGYEQIIFTLYQLSWAEKTDCSHLVEFAQRNPLFGYTFDYSLCNIDGYVEKMLRSGVPLFIHTVNDTQQQNEFFNIGISGIYTDNTVHK